MTAVSAGAYEANWYAGAVATAPECRVLADNLDVDVCVIGGEFAGLTIAYALARRGWSVAVLEPERIGAGGTASGTGIVAPGFCEPPEGIVARVGADRAKALWQLSASGVERVRDTIDAAGLTDAVAPQPGLLLAERADREAAVQRSVDLIGGTFGVEAEYWPSARVREVLRSGLLHQAVHFPRAFHIQPLHYVLGLAAAARNLGVRIYECTPVQRVDAFGIRKQVDAAGWRVRARHIVLAASGDLGALHPSLAGTALSLSYPVGITAPLGDRLAEAVRFAGAAVSGPAAMSHRIVGGDRLMWAGALTPRQKPPRRLADRIGRAILRTYPQLAGLAVEHAWYARGDYTAHRMPQIGELAPGLWLAAAFGHHGIATAAMAGDLIARAILEGDDRWRLFRSYGLVWTGGVVGRAMVGAALSLSHARSVLRERKTSARLPPASVAAAAPVAEPAVAEASTSKAPALETPTAESVAAEPATAEAVVAPSPGDEATVAGVEGVVQATSAEAADEAHVAERSLPEISTADAPQSAEPSTIVEAPDAPSAEEPIVEASATEAPEAKEPAAETPVAEPPLVVTAPEAQSEPSNDEKDSGADAVAAQPATSSASRKKKAGAPREKKPPRERVVRAKRQSKPAKGKAASKVTHDSGDPSVQPTTGDTPPVAT